MCEYTMKDMLDNEVLQLGNSLCNKTKKKRKDRLK